LRSRPPAARLQRLLLLLLWVRRSCWFARGARSQAYARPWLLLLLLLDVPHLLLILLL
jgi:hypothetical protein